MHITVTHDKYLVTVMAIVFAVLVHAAVPRYTWSHVQGQTWSRVDRWTGSISVWRATPAGFVRVTRPAEGEGFDRVWHAMGWNHDARGWYWPWFRGPRTGTFRAEDIDPSVDADVTTRIP